MKKEHKAILWAIVIGVLCNIIASAIMQGIASKNQKQCSTN